MLAYRLLFYFFLNEIDKDKLKMRCEMSYSLVKNFSFDKDTKFLILCYGNSMNWRRHNWRSFVVYPLSAQIIFIEKRKTCNFTIWGHVSSVVFVVFTLRFKRHFWSLDSVLFVYGLLRFFFGFVLFCMVLLDWLAVTMVYGGSY